MTRRGVPRAAGATIRPAVQMFCTSDPYVSTEQSTTSASVAVMVGAT